MRKILDEELYKVVAHLNSPTIRELQTHWKNEFGRGIISSRAAEFRRKYFSSEILPQFDISQRVSQSDSSQRVFDLSKFDEQQISVFEKEIEENSNRISELQNRNKELRSELSVLKMKASYESRIRELEEENSLLKKQFFEAHENKFHSSPKETHIETEIGTVDWDEYERLQEEEQERNNFQLLEELSFWWDILGNCGDDGDGADDGPYNDVSDSLLSIATSVKSAVFLKYPLYDELENTVLSEEFDGTLIISDNSPKPTFKETAEALLEQSKYFEQPVVESELVEEPLVIEEKTEVSLSSRDFRRMSSRDFRRILKDTGISEVLFFKTHVSAEKAYFQNLCEGSPSLGWHVKLPGDEKFTSVGGDVASALEYLESRGFIPKK